jgi:hypothetical protein
MERVRQSQPDSQRRKKKKRKPSQKEVQFKG